MLKILGETLKQKGIEETNIIKIDFESLTFYEYRNDRALYEFIMQKATGLQGKIYILIDEIQEVDGWEYDMQR